MIAVMPTYAAFGVAAPVLLGLARMIQGLSLGGEYGTSATYLTEIADEKHRGFYSSFQYVTLIGGQLCAILVLLVLQQLFLTRSRPVRPRLRFSMERLSTRLTEPSPSGLYSSTSRSSVRLHWTTGPMRTHSRI